jgi:6-phosphogluconolactonase (cycloisomerase 2 family)
LLVADDGIKLVHSTAFPALNDLGFATNPTGTLVVSINSTSNLLKLYRFNATDGTLQEVTSREMVQRPTAAAFTGSGSYVATCDADDHSVEVYAVSPNSIERVPGSPVAVPHCAYMGAAIVK